jgi:hypothetical protein
MAHAAGGHGGGGGALKEFFIALGLDSDASSFASAQAAVDTLEKGLDLAFEAAEKLFEGFVEAVEGTAEYAHAVEHAAEKTGLATDTIQQLAYVSEQAGVASDSLQQGFVHMAKSMDEVRKGGEEATQAYARLGVRVLDANGKLRKQDDVFNDVADALARLPPGAERTALALGVFGKSGAELIPVLGKGSAAIREQMAAAEQLGLVMSEESIERGARFAKGLETLKAVGASVVHDFAEPLIEALNPLIDGMIEWIKVNRELIRTRVQEFARLLVKGIEALSWLVVAVVDNFWKLVAVLRVLAVVLVSRVLAAMVLNIGAFIALIPEIISTIGWYLALSVQAVAAAVASAAAWLSAAAPLVLVTLLVAALILGFQDLFVFLRGGRSVIGRVLNGYADQIETFWESMKAIVVPWWFSALFGDKAIDKVAWKIGDWAASVGQSPQTSDFVKGGAASPAAAAAFSPGPVGQNADGSFVFAPTTQITIHAGSNASGAEIGAHVGRAVDEANDRMLREAKAPRK